jgi:hypothetical protein
MQGRRSATMRRNRASRTLNHCPPGWKHLNSFDIPGLLAGIHEIRVTQKISTTDPGETGTPEKSVDARPQTFEILGPRFELPEDAIYSVFPENGHAVAHDVLPHIVFNDRMMPWERPARNTAPQKQPDDYDSNRVPWMACLTFTADELQLASAEMSAIFAGTSIATTAKQTDSLNVSVPIAELGKVNSEWAKLPITDDRQATKPNTNLIFPKVALINALFPSYDDANQPHASSEGGADISRHRFLAHAVQINPKGMANADRSEEEPKDRQFSVLIANRSGPLVSADGKPVQVFVHVVSLEDVETKLNPFPLPVKKDQGKETRVGLISLYSWSYMCLPPDSLNVADAFENLARTSTMLKPVMPKYDPPPKGKDPIDELDPTKARLIKRLRDGYIMIRSLTATGEETAALMRSPLTPTCVAPNLMTFSSNSGSKLQILDQKLGMMDMSFSLTWNLGRTLAMADRAYTIALTRVRRQILKLATDEARLGAVRATSRQQLTREELLQSLSGLVDDVVNISRRPNLTVLEDKDRPVQR